jgi:hypothetical protein
MKKNLSVSFFCLFAGLLWSCLTPSFSSAVEVITVRSGQSGGVPGAPGALDDIVNFNPWGNPGGLPVLGTPFTPADYAATDAGPSARVITPLSVWMGGAVAPLSDPLARWINFESDPSSGYGIPAGSALYAVPFFINSATFSNATLVVEGGVDDWLGDALGGGPNPDGLYVNGVPSGLSTLTPADFNYAVPTTHIVDITANVTPGQNYLYFYQRDGGIGVSGLIFSATITVVPEPSSLGLLVIGLAFAFKRRLV